MDLLIFFLFRYLVLPLMHIDRVALSPVQNVGVQNAILKKQAVMCQMVNSIFVKKKSSSEIGG